MDLGAVIPQFGSVAWTVAFFVIALSVVVTIHELGHYLVARWCGIGAEVFSVGFGPVLLSRIDRRGTRWQLAALPLGGYVKFLGDADAASRPDAGALEGMDAAARRRSLPGAPLWARTATVAAGPGFNFILAFVLFAAVFAVQGQVTFPFTVAQVQPMPPVAGAEALLPGDRLLEVEGQDARTAEAAAEAWAQLPDQPLLHYLIERDGRQLLVQAPHLFPPLIGSVMPRSAASEAGLKKGDVILSVDGQPLASFEGLRAHTAASQGAPLLLEVWRGGEVSSVALVPRETDLPTGGGGFEKRWLIGLTSGALLEGQTGRAEAGAVLEGAARQTWEVVVTTVSGIAHMLGGLISTCSIQGPIGIAEASGSMAAAGVAPFVMFIAFLSAAIGLMNLLPVPVLDGGHLLFFLWEALSGRAPGPRAMQVAMTVGLVAVVGLMALGLTNDLVC